MKIGVIHEINDPEAFGERGENLVEEAPEGIQNHQGCFPTNFTTGTCVWEAESVDELSEYIDPTLGDASKQEYFEIDEEVSEGVPE